MDGLSVELTIKFKDYYLFLYELSLKLNMRKLANYFVNRYIKSCKYKFGKQKWQKMNLDIEYEEIGEG